MYSSWLISRSPLVSLNDSSLICLYIYIYRDNIPLSRFPRERAEGHEFDFGKGGHLRPLAATCGHLRPLAATCGHLRPLALAATCSGGHYLRPLALAATCGHLRPLALAATCGHSIGCKWLQVVADEKKMRAATGGHSSGCKWLPMKNQMLVATGGHLRPLEWLQVAASGCRWEENAGGHWRPLDWLQVAASGLRRECWWPRAATRLAASGCKWLPLRRECWRTLAATRLAASGCKWLPMRRKCWWPLAATRLAASGCKWLPMRREWWRPLAATGDHSSGCKWLQVAAGVSETIFFTIHPLLGGEYWEFSVNVVGLSLSFQVSFFSLQRCPPLLISPSS